MKTLVIATFLLSSLAASAQTQPGPASNVPVDLGRTPTLYVVGYAHLDTQWRWEYPKTIGEYLPNTLHQNFDLFEKYPNYIFNFTGSNRYRMMKEYYPVDFRKLQQYVAAGRWFPSGSSVEESDVNSPAAESIILGQWDDRTWIEKKEQLPPRAGASADAPPRTRPVLEYTGLKPGYIKHAPVAWFASHRHTADGANEPYVYSYLFAYSIALPADARTLTLPDDSKIRILAVTVSNESSVIVPAQPLYDTLEK